MTLTKRSLLAGLIAVIAVTLGATSAYAQTDINYVDVKYNTFSDKATIEWVFINPDIKDCYTKTEIRTFDTLEKLLDPTGIRGTQQVHSFVGGNMDEGDILEGDLSLSNQYERATSDDAKVSCVGSMTIDENELRHLDFIANDVATYTSFYAIMKDGTEEKYPIEHGVYYLNEGYVEASDYMDWPEFDCDNDVDSFQKTTGYVSELGIRSEKIYYDRDGTCQVDKYKQATHNQKAKFGNIVKPIFTPNIVTVATTASFNEQPKYDTIPIGTEIDISCSYDGDIADVSWRNSYIRSTVTHTDFEIENNMEAGNGINRFNTATYTPEIEGHHFIQCVFRDVDRNWLQADYIEFISLE